MFRQTKRKLVNRRNLAEEDPTIKPEYLLQNVHTSGDVAFQENYFKESFSTDPYANLLSMYERPPIGEITLEEFEVWAIDRLKLLLELESYHQRNRSIKEMIEQNIFKGLVSKAFSPGNTNYNFRKDYYSHHILRLCFCSNNDLRNKFIRDEILLFKLRFENMNSSDQEKFIATCPILKGKNIETVSQEELTDSMQENLFRVYGNKKINNKVIKLPFEDVIEMVGQRQVYLYKGFAYLPESLQMSYIVSEYQKFLESELLYTFRSLPRLNEDDRLLPILNHLGSGYMISDYNEQNSALSASDSNLTHSNVYASENFENYPLCMQNLLQGLKLNSHLKYNGRQQLSLFLKSCGLGIDEAMKFWENSFAKKYPIEKFNKEYRYSFRHNYGMEGNRINYRPWDCATILSKPRPSKEEFHGCPFRDWNEDRLRSTLKQKKDPSTGENLTNQQVNSVVDSCKQNDYTIACTKYFELTHATLHNEEQITHPNLFYERAVMSHKKEEEIDA